MVLRGTLLVTFVALLGQCGYDKINPSEPESGASTESRTEINLENLLSREAYPSNEQELSQAIVILEEALTSNENDARITARLGQFYSDLGDFEKAISYMQRSIELHEDLENYLWLATFYHSAWRSTSKNEYRVKGIACIDQLVNLRGNDLLATYSAATLYEDFGECAKALDSYKTAMDLLETYKPVKINEQYLGSLETQKERKRDDIRMRIDRLSADCEMGKQRNKEIKNQENQGDQPAH